MGDGKRLTDKNMEDALDIVSMDFPKGVMILGFDEDNQVHGFCRTNNQMEVFALRGALIDLTSREALDQFLPAGFDEDIDDDE